ncbi:hypothetical protein [Agrobacterium pusense]|uniref:hypothetical protein n=1 Tax=Agrobacterium pusense TaxID=648995 RepID=UPI00088BE320|nr:hypothetical protein [Agrobacterium pusense]MBW9058317.1 hypothetical protein [Agrobacterium pusense]OOO17185.1 hypothetical protein BTE56_18245 [Agrobacterium pusense]WKD45596.1 hypothetical protein M8C82_19640 [Agrobacterium pusense]SDF27608.1 hypothetical protein SAMN05421750_109194 [Agrobacterium pusense]
MTVTSLNPASQFDVALVRNAAADLRPMLMSVRNKALATQHLVQGAKSLGSIVLYYAKWLGVWHKSGLETTWAMHFSGQQFPNGRHAVAALQIKTEMAAVTALVSGKAHWIALPHLESTRRALITNLLKTMNALDAAIESCAVLEGRIERGRLK